MHIPRDGERLAAAACAIHLARAAAARQRVIAAEGRSRLAALDAFIAILEARNLTANRTFDRKLRARLEALARELPVPLPRRAQRARNTARLHTVLLDWQETVLDAIHPERHIFCDVDASEWSEDATLTG